MEELRLVVAPVGKVESEEVEIALGRVSKVLRRPLWLSEALPVPQGVEDTARRQFRASAMMQRLQARLPQLGPGKPIGGGEAGAARPGASPAAHIFVTDVDLFTAKTDGVFAALSSIERVGVVSVRRLRESFYRRKADPAKQRARLAKELIRVASRLLGLKECPDPKCAVSGSRLLVDVDLKEEKICRTCSEWLFSGRIRI